ncbi:MAG: transcriptional antiterminator, Rof [Gammaproteobacteria bacterium]|jgi:Rho-binding antiterminator
MTDYTPVDCGLYSRYELDIVRREPLRVSWRRRDGQVHVEVLRPLDLETRNHEEFMIAEGLGGNRVELRLDRILRTEAAWAGRPDEVWYHAAHENRRS